MKIKSLLNVKHIVNTGGKNKPIYQTTLTQNHKRNGQNKHVFEALNQTKISIRNVQHK